MYIVVLHKGNYPLVPRNAQSVRISSVERIFKCGLKKGYLQNPYLRQLAAKEASLLAEFSAAWRVGNAYESLCFLRDRLEVFDHIDREDSSGTSVAFVPLN